MLVLNIFKKIVNLQTINKLNHPECYSKSIIILISPVQNLTVKN